MVTIKTYQRSVTEQPGPVVPVKAPQSALGALAKGVGQVGDMAQGFQDEIDTADAKSADADLSTLIRETLYADQTGYMYSQGGDAVNRRQSAADVIERGQAEILSNLSPAARNRAESAMRARMERAFQNIDQHSTGQGRVYLDRASDARILSSTNDAIFNPDMVAQSLATNRQEILDKADRNGWPKEQTDLALMQSSSAVHAGIIGRVATVDPSAAMEYLKQNRNSMLGSEVARLEAQLTPMVRERAGRNRGAAAAQQGLPQYEHSTVIDFNMGPNRPNKPDQPVLDVIGRSVQDVLGTGARVVVTSGQEDEGHQHGSNRHKTGNAADIQIIRPDGSVVKANDPDAALIARAAAGLGAKGIGWGEEYMGGDHFHIDLVDPGAGQASTWGSQGTAMRGEIDEIIASRGTAGTLEDLVAIQDPDEREAAISEYNLITGLRAKRVEAKRQAAETAAFQHIEAGGNVSDIPFEHRASIGREAMSSLRSYQDKLAAGDVQTDDVFYIELMDQLARNPDQFMTQDPMLWRDKLDDKDFDYFAKQRADLISGARRSGQEGMTVSTLRTAASSALKAAGLGDNTESQAKFETQLLRWSSAFAAENNRDPSPLELNERINQMLVPVILDPEGLWNKQGAMAFQMDYDGDPMNPADDVTPQMLRNGALRINDTSVSNDVIEAYASGFSGRFGRAPTVQELVDGIIASGMFE